MTTAPLFIYLHGFASSPGGYKVAFFVDALRAHGVEPRVPDMNLGNFKELTISGQVAEVQRLSDAQPDRPVVLLGSSMGAYVAALFASRCERVEALVLMAPAFGFADRWAARLGEQEMARWQTAGQIDTMHYGLDRMTPIGWGLMADARTQPPTPDLDMPTLIMHGSEDDVVDPQGSMDYAANRPNVTLILLPDDHTLGTVVETMVQRAVAFLSPWLDQK